VPPELDQISTGTAVRNRYEIAPPRYPYRYGFPLLGCKPRGKTYRSRYVQLEQTGTRTGTRVKAVPVPLGREYFFVFEVGGKRRLVRTSGVTEIAEV